MNKNLTVRRIVEITALLLLGEGVIGLIKPRGYSLLWRIGPSFLRSAVQELAAHPHFARSIYAAEAALGIALASSQTREANL